MEKWKFVIRIGIVATNLRLGTCFFLSYAIYTVIICNFVKQCNISNSDEQMYILQMSVINVYV